MSNSHVIKSLLGLLLVCFLMTAPSAVRAETPLQGGYVSSSEHPGVFTTPAELKNLVARINAANSFSARMFEQLERQIQADLSAKTDWDASYSGCDIETYLHTFSYEPADGYANEIRSRQQLLSSLKLGPTAIPPAGAAVVASRLALYATLIKQGAMAPKDSPSADQAAVTAKHILLAWANHGFRDLSGQFLNTTGQFCDASGKPVYAGVALQISRGVIYSVQAQDLLQSLGALDRNEEQKLSIFHNAMFDLIRNTSNEEFDYNMHLPYPNMAYNNQFANHLTGLLAIARLLDDKKKFEATLYGGNPEIDVKLPWTVLFNHLVYGVNDVPLPIHPNYGPDALKSRPSYVTSVVAPGEINDRYRNANPLQGIGYPMFALERLFMSAEIMKNAGIDGYSYRGSHQQSIQMADDYYACYEKYAGSSNVITEQNSKSCPDYQQYLGKKVNEVAPNIAIGAWRFPKDSLLVELNPSSELEMAKGPFALDAILFGKWTD